MKKAIFLMAGCLLATGVWAQTIELQKPTLSRGSSIMEALHNRKSSRSYDSKQLSDQDLSDLLWAAVGVNRADGRRTSPTAQNAQDVDVYACRADGTYRYDAANHRLVRVTEQDIRPLLEGNRPTGAPVCLLVVSDVSRYPGYKAGEANAHYREMGGVDSGIVSQNISLFCSGVGLATVPRASMDQQKVRAALSLTDTQTAWLNHPIGYPGQ